MVRAAAAGRESCRRCSALRATGERDIETIVDHHTRSRSLSCADEIGDDCGQLRGLEIAFANLNEVNSGLDGPRGLLGKTPAIGLEAGGLGTQPTAIGHETLTSHHIDRPAPSPRETLERSRALNTTASSANPTTRFTIPRPLTPPRTKLLVRIPRTSGHAAK